MNRKTEVYGTTPDELKNQILSDVKKELKNFFEGVITSEKKREEEYLTRKEASEMLKVSLVTISEWSKIGIIKPLRLGNLIRFKKSDLEKSMIEKNQNQINE